MPRRGENIYKRKDGRWEGRVLCQNGKYQYIYATTYREVKEKKLQMQKQMDRAAPISTPAAGEAFTAWLSGDLKSQVKPSTYESYYHCITAYVLPFYRERKPNTISVQSTLDFSDKINARQELSISYRRKILSIYKTALRQILKGNSECSSILNAVTLPKSCRTDVQAFTIKEQRLIEKAVADAHDRCLVGILLCFYTGLRLGEVCGLKWGDIDLDAGILSVERTVSRTKNFTGTGAKTSLTVGSPKSEHSIRKIPLPNFLLDELRTYRADLPDVDCFLLSGKAAPLDPRKYQKLFQTILKRAGVKSHKFHAIRHTFATRALELGVDIKTLSEILGHSSASVTLNIYAHSLFEQKKKAMEKLNAMYVACTESAACAVTDAVVNA